MWAKARGIDEPLRYLTSLSALAEAMWMTGKLDSRVTEFGVSHLAELGSTPDTRGSAGLFRVWLRRLGLEADEPGDVAEPHRLALDGQHAAAASWWRAAGDVFSEAMAFADSPDPEHRMHAVSLLDRAGAIGTADRLRVELRQQGLSMVPQRPRESTRINPGGLTNRQLDVARLVARGLSNGEIAAQLYISPKTADHHVSAILVKLQLASRRAVRERAAELGLS
jgi:DNA-binding CsgD family transcriptional regulator